MPGHALLLMGGIGDFAHYLTRLPAFMRERRLAPADLHVFVESVVPDQAEAIFKAALPQLRYAFLPPSIHWVNTFPLLTPARATDREHRPAYRYVKSLGFEEVTDWFLPFLCAGYEFDSSPLLRVVAGVKRREDAYVVVSARDKGFLWWPAPEVCADVRSTITAAGRAALFVGTPNEPLPGGCAPLTLACVREALALSYHAQLFVGTDTGLATFRELTGRRNIYCVSRYWRDEVMVRFGYFDNERRRSTPSAFAFDAKELLGLLTAELHEGRSLLRRGGR